jgi:hypothetical protein
MTREPNAKKQAAKKANGEDAVPAKIAGMPDPNRAVGERLHDIITKSAPGLAPGTWYGMPASARFIPALDEATEAKIGAPVRQAAS